MALLMWLAGCYYNPLDLPLVDEVPIVANDRCAPAQEAFVRDSAVIDGDTFDVDELSNDLPLRIRMLGINATEISSNDCWSQEAKIELRRRIAGTTVLLTFDRECLDVFADPEDPTTGRTLAYVWDLDDPGKSINLQMVEEGWAKVYRPPDGADFGDFIYQQQFDRAEQEAMAQGLGLWGNCPE